MKMAFSPYESQPTNARFALIRPYAHYLHGFQNVKGYAAHQAAMKALERQREGAVRDIRRRILTEKNMWQAVQTVRTSDDPAVRCDPLVIYYLYITCGLETPELQPVFANLLAPRAADYLRALVDVVFYGRESSLVLQRYSLKDDQEFLTPLMEPLFACVYRRRRVLVLNDPTILGRKGGALQLTEPVYLKLEGWPRHIAVTAATYNMFLIYSFIMREGAFAFMSALARYKL
jgi:hypothetical protein